MKTLTDQVVEFRIWNELDEFRTNVRVCMLYWIKGQKGRHLVLMQKARNAFENLALEKLY